MSTKLMTRHRVSGRSSSSISTTVSPRSMGGKLGRGSSSSPSQHGWGLTRCWPQGSRAGKPHATSDELQLINRRFDAVSSLDIQIARRADFSQLFSIKRYRQQPALPQPVRTPATLSFQICLDIVAEISGGRAGWTGAEEPMAPTRARCKRVETLKRSVGF